MKISIRDMLWLTVVAALLISWWIDNKRIEDSLAKTEKDRRLMQADFDDKLTLLDEVTKQRQKQVMHSFDQRVPRSSR